MNWSDIQLQVQLPTCGFNFNDNVGKARIRGAELAMDGTVVSGVTVGASAVYLDAAITDVAQSRQFKVGDRLPNIPRQWYTAYAQYEFNYAASVRGYLRADYQYRGSAVRGASSQSRMANYHYQGWDQTSLNLGAEWGSWQGRLFVDNVFNANPEIDFFTAWGQWRTSTLRPRTIGINLGVTF
jgi:outer membrane receptor protein involved in Fe transport